MDPDPEKSGRVMKAMLPMKKIDLETLKRVPTDRARRETNGDNYTSMNMEKNDESRRSFRDALR
jgi:hypothetical protein